MLIDGALLRQEMERELEVVTKAMLAGTDTWEEYLKLVGAGQALAMNLEQVRSLERRAREMREG